MNEERVAHALGWFSIGLGLTEVVAGRALGRTLGMERQTGLLRAFGLREIAAGVGILARPRPTAWMWARVAGDALDLAALGSAYTDDNPERENLGLAIGAVAGITALDLWCAWRLTTRGYLTTRARGGESTTGSGHLAEAFARR
jgi:hypothetical protein